VVDVAVVAGMAKIRAVAGSASGGDLPPLKGKILTLVALDLARVVRLCGVGPGLESG
jgi:hypothetical protein